MPPKPKKPRKEKVIKVVDGDTFLTNRRKYAVRLEGTDAPEKRQKGYQKAKEALKKLILNEEVSITTVAHDKYKRAIAEVKLKDRSINKTMEKFDK